MPRKRKIKVDLSAPLVIPDAAFELLAEEFIEWQEKKGRERQAAAKQQNKLSDDDTDKTKE